MKITIIQADGVVGIDGTFRSVDLSALDPEIHAIQFDTERATGKVEFDPFSKEEVEVRALDQEQAQETPLRERLEQTERALEEATRTKDKPRTRQMRDRADQLRAQLNALQPIMQMQRAPRRPVVLDPAGFVQYQGYVEAWRAAKPKG